MATATNQKRLLFAVGAVLAVVALVLGITLAGGDGDDDDEGGGDTTTTTAATTSTSGAPSSTDAPTTTLAPTPADIDVAAYPDLRGETRFDDPGRLVRAFATQVLGFDTDLVVGEYLAGDSRSGEVVVRPTSESGQPGPPSTVAVRQVSDDSWVVVTAFTETIQVVEPEAGMPISSPQVLRGSAAAFEGHVDVALYADGQPTPIATTFVTGRGDGVLGDFEGELTFEVPEGATHGMIVLSEPSAQDGTTWAATALRVRFAG